MKNIKTILFVFVLIIVFLISAVFLFGLTKSQSDSVLYYYFHEQYPLKVVIKSEDGVTEIYRQDDAFEVNGFEDIPLNEIFCSEIFRLMKKLEIKNVVKPEHDLQDYGLSEPKVRIRADFDEYSTVLRIGDITPDRTACYCLEEGRKEIGLIPIAKIDPFFRKHSQYASLNLIPYAAKTSDHSVRIRKCIIKRPDLPSPVELVLDKSGKLKIFGSEKLKIPEETMIQLENLPTWLIASSVYASHPTDELIELCGMRDPKAEVTYVIDDKTYSFKIGRVSNFPKSPQSSDEYLASAKNIIYKSYYVMMDKIPAIYTLHEDSVPWLNMRFR